MKTKEEIEAFREFVEDTRNRKPPDDLTEDLQRKHRIFFMQASRILGWVLELDKDDPIFAVNHKEHELLGGGSLPETTYSYKFWPTDDGGEFELPESDDCKITGPPSPAVGSILEKEAGAIPEDFPPPVVFQRSPWISLVKPV